MAQFTLDEIPAPLAVLLPADGRIEPSPQGQTSDVAFVTGAHGSVVVKRCTRAIYLEWLRNEHRALRALAGLGLPVPTALGYVEVEDAPGLAAWLAMSRLPGRSLWSRVLETPVGARAPLFRSLGELLRRVHTAPLPAPFARRPEWTSRTLAEARRNLGWCDGTPELLAELRRAPPPPMAECLIHGDLALDNVLIDDAGNLSLIDWAGGTCGDPRYDIALALQTKPETELADEERLAFYSGYGAPELDGDTRRWFELLYEFF
jgi:aminoglycoside phosphotransferase (APT) family kinase protein